MKVDKSRLLFCCLVPYAWHMTNITETDRQALIRRFPVLTETAEHECDEYVCPCFTVLEVLENEWNRRLLAGDDFGACGLRFDEFVAKELDRAGLLPDDDDDYEMTDRDRAWERDYLAGGNGSTIDRFAYDSQGNDTGLRESDFI